MSTIVAEHELFHAGAVSFEEYLVSALPSGASYGFDKTAPVHEQVPYDGMRVRELIDAFVEPLAAHVRLLALSEHMLMLTLALACARTYVYRARYDARDWSYRARTRTYPRLLRSTHAVHGELPLTLPLQQRDHSLLRAPACFDIPELCRTPHAEILAVSTRALVRQERPCAVHLLVAYPAC